MELREQIISVLRGHGVIKMSVAPLCMVDLVEIYLTDFEDMLMSKLLRDVAERYGVEKRILMQRLGGLARQIHRKDPQWYCETFPEGYSTPVFLRAVAREVQLSLWDAPPLTGIG